MLSTTYPLALGLGLLLIKHSSPKTTTVEWTKIPDNCLNPWTIQPRSLKVSSASLTALALTNTDIFQSLIGIKCDNGTMTLCEGIVPTDETNLCTKEFKRQSSQLLIKKQTVTSITKELYILFENEGRFLGVNKQNYELSIPPLQNENVVVKFQNGIFACHIKNKACQFMAEDSSNWTPFPSMNFHHSKGSLNSIGGKVLAMGGYDDTLGLHPKMEIFNGNKWIPLPDLDAPRCSFATVAINSTSLVLIGGYKNTHTWPNVATDFLMYHVDTMQWVSLPDFSKKEIDMACCNLDSGSVQGILCVGGDSPVWAGTDSRYAFVFAWKTLTWSRMPRFDFLDNRNIMGSIIQFNDCLYYSPFFNRERTEYMNQVFKIDLNVTNATWQDLGMPTLSKLNTFRLFYQVKLFTIG